MVQERCERGQASVELIAAIPALLLVTMIVAQLTLVGYALWSAGVAARAGARAAYVNGDARRAARSSLPRILRRGTEISGHSGVRVRIPVPALIPGMPRLPVTARAGLGAGNGAGR